MFKKFIFCLVIFALSTSVIFAQTDQDDEEIHNFEVYGGVNINKDFTKSFNPTTLGVEGSFVKNVNRFVGIKADSNVSFNNRKYSYRIKQNGNFETEPIEIKRTDYNFLGGVQFKDNRKEGSRLRPFAHALVGIGVNNTKVNFSSSGLCGTEVVICPISETEVGFSAAFGGGLDIKLNDKISIRAIQVDYNPRRFAELGFQNNVRFGAGIVFH